MKAPKSKIIMPFILGRKIVHNINLLKLIDKSISMNVMCSACKKVTKGPRIAHVTSHGLCLDCIKNLYSECYEEMAVEFEGR